MNNLSEIEKHEIYKQLGIASYKYKNISPINY